MQVCEPLSIGSSTSVRNVFRFRFQKKVESSAKKTKGLAPSTPPAGAVVNQVKPMSLLGVWPRVLLDPAMTC